MLRLRHVTLIRTIALLSTFALVLDIRISASALETPTYVFDVPNRNVEAASPGTDVEPKKIDLLWDFTNGRPAREPTQVYLDTDGKELRARFVATQREAIVATQHVDDSGEGSDDEVTLYLWPSGSNGFRYGFSATPNGTHSRRRPKIRAMRRLGNRRVA